MLLAACFSASTQARSIESVSVGAGAMFVEINGEVLVLVKAMNGVKTVLLCAGG